MSTICLAAQRSYVSGEAVWFSYRIPRLRKIASNAFLGIVSLCVMLMAGLYAHVYWQLRHPAPEPVKKSERGEARDAAFRYALRVREQAVPASAPETRPGAGRRSCHAGSAD